MAGRSSARMTAAQVRASLAKAARGNKFGNRKVVDPHTGEKFDSQGEYDRWAVLRLLERAGKIDDLDRQVSIRLFSAKVDGARTPVLIRSEGYPGGRHATYIADFAYFDCTLGRQVYEDFKGADTALSRLKRAIVEAMTGHPVLISKKG